MIATDDASTQIALAQYSSVSQTNSKYLSQYRENFCPPVGNTGELSVRYQQPLFFFWPVKVVMVARDGNIMLVVRL
jgi:hypothetical protein